MTELYDTVGLAATPGVEAGAAIPRKISERVLDAHPTTGGVRSGKDQSCWLSCFPAPLLRSAAPGASTEAP
jgi:hypothetical protein